MGMNYEKLVMEEKSSKREEGMPLGSWRMMRRVVRVYVRTRRRRRWMRRVAWVGLWVKLRQVFRKHRRVEGTTTRSYDFASYTMNFDDGRWKEEEDFWRSRSFSFGFGN